MKFVKKQNTILGIDPGFGRVGWAVIKENGNDIDVLAYDCLETPKEKTAYKRLEMIYKKMQELIQMHNPTVVAVEEIFFGRNVTTALQVGTIHGVVQLAAVQKGIEIFYYTPAHVKISVAGYGNADKSQVQKMVKSVLHLKEIPKPDDAADALAIALTHSFRKNIQV